MRSAFEIPAGLVSDDTTFQTPGRWEDGSNVRFWRNQAQTIGGWSALNSEALTGVCRNTLAWTDLAGALNIAFGTHEALQLYIGGAVFDITPVGLLAGTVDASPGPGYGSGPWDTDTYGTPRTLTAPRTWSLSTYGQSLIACPSGGTIYQWANVTGDPAEAVLNAPDRVTYALVTPERQLLAFGCNEEVSGDFNPLCIRGSDIEDITDWTTASNNNAFEQILEGGGRIVAARLLGSLVMVWTDNGLYQGQFIGQPGQAYRFDRIGDNCGLIGPNAVAVTGQAAFWISTDYQFRMWTPGNSVQIIQCPIRNDFKDNIDQSQREKIVATSIDTYGEVWWHYPDARDGNENSRYVAVSALDGTWFRGRMARSAAMDAGVAGFPIMVAPDGFAYYHEIGQTANGGPLNWFLKSSDQYIGAGQENLFIRGVWPDFEDQQGSVTMTLGMRQYPQGDVRTKGPYVLEASRDKRDFRATGRIASVRFDGASAPSFVRFGKFAFDVVTAGAR